MRVIRGFAVVVVLVDGAWSRIGVVVVVVRLGAAVRVMRGFAVVVVLGGTTTARVVVVASLTVSGGHSEQLHHSQQLWTASSMLPMTSHSSVQSPSPPVARQARQSAVAPTALSTRSALTNARGVGRRRTSAATRIVEVVGSGQLAVESQGSARAGVGGWAGACVFLTFFLSFFRSF